MSKPIVILHGWSDERESFENLARFFRDQLVRPATIINLADWLSLDDNVTYADLREAMDRAWNDHGLPRKKRSVDVVIHSTSALVVREWMTHYFTPATVPIHHFLMLAPANYGSPLGHKGRTFYGRILKGFKTGLQTGTQLLKGLELASPYSWELAQKDILDSKRWYGKNRILATVLVGGKGYDGVKAAANEKGGDGTVRVSTANLYATQVSVDFTQSSAKPRVEWRRPPEGTQIAFGILKNDNHGTITMKQHGTPKTPGADSLMLEALSVLDAGWDTWCSELTAFTDGNPPKAHAYQNLVVRVSDDLGQQVEEYFVEFYDPKVDPDKGSLAKAFHETIIQSVHAYADAPSHRSFYVDTTALGKKLASLDAFTVGLIADPESPPSPVGYSTRGEERGNTGVTLDREQQDSFFRPNETTFVDIVLKRNIENSVFEMDTLDHIESPAAGS